MDGWWECEALDDMIARILRAKLDSRIVGIAPLFTYLLSRLTNQQRRGKAFEVGEKHYDIGNDLYEAMLDHRMTYTCAYWKDLERVPENLDSAQEAKLDLVCRKLGLDKRTRSEDGEPLHILDIGCGWGSFAIYVAEKYGVRVTGVTVSKEQVVLAEERAHEAGVADKVEFRLQDYRDVKGEYDHIVSLGMFEHVGHKNYRTYFDVVRKMLKPEGLFVLQTIGHNHRTSGVDPWITKYIFPNGMIPQSSKTVRALEGLFVLEDWHNFGPDYNTTLIAWHKNFERWWCKRGVGLTPSPAVPRTELCSGAGARVYAPSPAREEGWGGVGGVGLNPTASYDDRFHRMWRYYLLACAGAFRARSIQLWQIVLSPNGVEGGYETVR